MALSTTGIEFRLLVCRNLGLSALKPTPRWICTSRFSAAALGMDEGENLGSTVDHRESWTLGPACAASSSSLSLLFLEPPGATESDTSEQGIYHNQTALTHEHLGKGHRRQRAAGKSHPAGRSRVSPLSSQAGSQLEKEINKQIRK